MSITFKEGSWYNGEALIEASNTPFEIDGKTYLLVDKGEQGYQNIQDAVADASDGAIILIAPGTYAEQVSVVGATDLTIEAVGPGVKITAPANLTETDAAYWDYDIAAIISVNNSTNVTISGVTVDGADSASAKPEGTEFAGVFFNNSSGTLENSEVTGIQPEALGTYNSRAVAVANDAEHKDNAFTATGNVFENFEKSAIVVRQAEVSITNNTITGTPNGIIAQNGLDLGDNVTGVVSGNTVEGIGFAPEGDNPYFSSGILIWGAGNELAVHSNTITGVDAADNFGGILIQTEGAGAGISVYDNTINTASIGVYEYAGENVGSVDTDGPNGNLPNQVTNVTTGYVLYTDGAQNTTTPFIRTGTDGDDFMQGQAGADNLNGGAGNDEISGGAGDDVLNGGDGVDVIDGGEGIDTAVYGAGAEIAYDAVKKVWTVTVGNVTDTLTSVERVTIGGETYILAGGGAHVSLNAAIADAVDGQTILVASGTYAETVTVTKDVTLRSLDGAKATTIIEGSIHVMANGVTVDGFTIENGSPFNGAGPAAILVQANGVTLTNNVLDGSETSLANARGVEVTAGTGQNLTISNNVIEGWATGIYANAGVSGTVSGNLLTGNYVGISADDPDALEIDNNTFTGNDFEQLAFGVTAESFNVTDYLIGSKFTGTAPEVSIYGLSNDGQTITGSEFDEAIHGGEGDDLLIGGGGEDMIDGGKGIDTAGYPADAKLAQKDGHWTVTVGNVVEVLTNIEKVKIGNQTYVLVDNVGAGDGFTTIKEAIDAAAAGDIVMVAAGEYTGPVVVDKDVTIAGAQAGIGGYGRLNSGSETTIKGGIHVEAAGVTLDGLKISGAGTILGEKAGIYVDVAGVSIINSILMGAGEVGSRGVLAGAGADNLTVSDNYMTGWSNGAYLNPGVTGTVTGNVLTGNAVGISMDDPAGLSVSGNVLFGNQLENIGVGVSTETVDVTGVIGANTILSTAPGGDVSFWGSGSGQSFQGTVYADTFNGTSGMDTFAGGAGNDVINGGNGVDTVVFSGKRSDYTVSLGQDGKVTIADLRGNGGTGTDIVSDVESFKFANGTISRETLVNNEAPTAVSLDGDRRVAENAANGTVIGALSATDVNVDDTHVYELVDNAGGRFAISDGKLVVANGSLLDYEKGTSHLVQVKVTDFSGASHVQDLTITVGNVNEAPTDIVVSGGTVLENSANGTEVASLSGVDQDAGDTFSFSLLDNAGGRFVIGGANGDKILVADSFKLDYEQATSHQVVVRVTDKSGASYNETVTLSVGDVRTENVSGSSGSDQISGGASKDVLNGGAGNDRLTGGAGKDTLTGGSGKDVFVFGNKDTGTSKGTADYITDFSGKAGDKIDLKLIDADTKKKGDQAFSFIGTSDFTKAGQVRYEKAKGETYVYLNTDSDKAAEGVIKLKGAIDLQKGWFVL